MAFLDPALYPLLDSLGPLWFIIAVSFIISVLITVVYKFFTDQSEMKRLKERQKEHQKKVKALRDRPDEMMKAQKEMMGLNMQYMKHSFKVTLITMLPIIILFTWLSGALAYEPIFPDTIYSVTADFSEGVTGEAKLEVGKETEVISDVTQPINSGVTWRLKSKSGELPLKVAVGKESKTASVLVTSDLRYNEPITTFEKESSIKSITVNHNELLPAGPKFSIFGWHPGWLGWYILTSIVFSIAMRKVMKVH